MLTATPSSTLKTDPRKSLVVTRDQLAALDPPVPLGPKHCPIPHYELVTAIDAEIVRRGYREVGSAFAISKKGQALFGVIDLELADDPDPKPECVRSLGFRGANDQSLALRMVAGARVLVCDNLALMGDMIALHRLHTTGLDLPAAVAGGFDRFLHHSTILSDHLERMGRTPLTDAQARALAFQIFADDVVPVSLLDKVNKYYFQPDEGAVDCHQRTLWSLHNAFTRAFRGMSSPRLFAATMALAHYFGMVSQADLPFDTEA
jgi:hypothetical protein